MKRSLLCALCLTAFSLAASVDNTLRIPLEDPGSVAFEVWESTAVSSEPEILYKEGFADDASWRPTKADDKGRSVSCVKVVENGDSHVRLGGQGRCGLGHGVCPANRISVTPGSHCTLTFSGRVPDMACTFAVYLKLFDRHGKNMSSAVAASAGWTYTPFSEALYKAPITLDGVGKWQDVKLPFAVPENVFAVLPCICPWRGDRVDCGGISFTSVQRVARHQLAFDQRTETADGGILLADTGAAITLAAVATKDAAGAVAVDVEVSDLSRPPRPRAVQVVLSLPKELLGWSWHKDWRNDETVGKDSAFQLLGSVGGHPVSRYPFSAVSRGGKGFALGTPFDEAAFENRTVSATGIRSTAVVGLLERNGHGTSAKLRWLAFGFRGNWGFRSAAKVYYASQARVFPPSHAGEKEGTWLWPVYPSKMPESPDDFGLTFWEAPATVARSPREVALAREKGIGIYAYTEAWGMRQPLTTLSGGGHPPVAERLAQLQSWAGTNVSGQQWFNAPRHLAAQAALNSLPVQPDGSHPYMVDKYDNWTHWWRTNSDPRLAKPNRASLCWDYTVGLDLEAIDGVYLDSLSYGFAVNFLNVRPEHLAVMTEKLIYDPETARPCADGIQHQVAFVRWVASELHARNKRVFGNVFDIAHRFHATTIDVFGSEVGSFGNRSVDRKASMQTVHSDADACEKRFYAYHRPVANLLQEGNYEKPVPALSAEEVAAYINHQLFYGFYPGISTIGGEKKPGYSTWLRYFDASRQCERDRAVFKAAIPLIRRMNRAKWMPETLMRAGDERVLVERYGEMHAGGECLFAVRNASEAFVKTPLAFDRSPEYAGTRLQPVWRGEGLAETSDGAWVISLAPWETAVFQVLP